MRYNGIHVNMTVMRHVGFLLEVKTSTCRPLSGLIGQDKWFIMFCGACNYYLMVKEQKVLKDMD